MSLTKLKTDWVKFSQRENGRANKSRRSQRELQIVIYVPTAYACDCTFYFAALMEPKDGACEFSLFLKSQEMFWINSNI